MMSQRRRYVSTSNFSTENFEENETHSFSLHSLLRYFANRCSKKAFLARAERFLPSLHLRFPPFEPLALCRARELPLCTSGTEWQETASVSSGTSKIPLFSRGFFSSIVNEAFFFSFAFGIERFYAAFI